MLCVLISFTLFLLATNACIQLWHALKLASLKRHLHFFTTKGNKLTADQDMNISTVLDGLKFIWCSDDSFSPFYDRNFVLV